MCLLIFSVKSGILAPKISSTTFPSYNKTNKKRIYKFSIIFYYKI